jgi:hypothetical protein
MVSNSKEGGTLDEKCGSKNVKKIVDFVLEVVTLT